MRAAILPVLALATLVASADPVPPGHERIAVIHLQLEGEPKFESVVLPLPPFPALLQHVCIREYDASAIRCYVLDTSKRNAPEWLTFDLKLKQ